MTTDLRQARMALRKRVTRGDNTASAAAAARRRRLLADVRLLQNKIDVLDNSLVSSSAVTILYNRLARDVVVETVAMAVALAPLLVGKSAAVAQTMLDAAVVGLLRGLRGGQADSDAFAQSRAKRRRREQQDATEAVLATEKTELLAHRGEILLALAARELEQKSAAAAFISRRAIAVKGALQQIGSRISAQLSAAPNSAAVETLLLREIVDALGAADARGFVAAAVPEVKAALRRVASK